MYTSFLTNPQPPQPPPILASISPLSCIPSQFALLCLPFYDYPLILLLPFIALQQHQSYEATETWRAGSAAALARREELRRQAQDLVHKQGEILIDYDEMDGGL